MFGLGKKRSKYGRFMDRHGISQEEVVRASGLNRDTVSKAYNEDDPNMRTITRTGLIRAAKELTGKNITDKDFWA